MAGIVINVIQVYLAVGVLVGSAFLALGVSRVVKGAEGSSPLFRLLILPGCAALWPVVLVKWLGRRERS